MTAPLTLLLASLLMAVSYLATAIVRGRALPDSISALVYRLSRPWQWLWIVWMWAVTLSLAPAFIEAMPPALQFVAFLSVAALMFVGAMPLVQSSPNRAHYAFSYVAAILSQFCVLTISRYWLLAWLAFPVLWLLVATSPRVAAILEGKGVLVLEILCSLCVYGSLFTVALRPLLGDSIAALCSPALAFPSVSYAALIAQPLPFLP